MTSRQIGTTGRPWMLDTRKPTFELTRLERGELLETLAVSPFGCADSAPLSIAEAHQVMQEHRGCMDCRIRRTAVRTLIEAGRIKPDSSRGRYRFGQFED